MTKSALENMNQFEVEELRFRTDMQRRRTKQGLSQGELARRIQNLGLTEFHQTTVSRIEKGTRPVRLGEAQAIAEALGTNAERMIRDEHVVELGEGLLRRAREMDEAGYAIVVAVEEYLVASAVARSRARAFRGSSSKEETAKIFGDQVSAAADRIESELTGDYMSYVDVGVERAYKEHAGVEQLLKGPGDADA